MINTVMEYTKHYESLIAKARARVTNPVEYYERHHVLPKCLGGDDSSDNLVDLTPEEHYTAHLLLVKIYPKNHSLVLAASMMTVNRCNNKRYGWLKRKHAAVMREFQSGSKNSQFGKVWMHSIEKKSSIKEVVIMRKVALPAGVMAVPADAGLSSRMTICILFVGVYSKYRVSI